MFEFQMAKGKHKAEALEELLKEMVERIEWGQSQ